MLEEWALSVPTHLRWDPNTADLTHFVQSSLLSVRYHAIRINVHNPFMRTTAHGLSDAAQSGRTLSGLTSSLTICTEAAVDCSEVLIAVMERFPRCLGQTGWADPAFVCGLVLLVNIFGFKTRLDEMIIKRFTAYAEACLEILKLASVNYPVAQPRRDTLSQLISELRQELSSSLSQTPVSRTVQQSIQSTSHWPENRTIPLSPNSTSHLLSTEPVVWARRADDMRLHEAQLTAQTSQQQFRLDEIPVGLRNQLSTGLQHPIHIYPPLHLDQAAA
ncbi:hypothetical protein BKA62DRAFT_831388 [Auriculariales sp. MPI-PUGE-AT-0066]|nr:hypothetical protein BKA62DRAFT_831388 [Auriculariales sp. MPI-PUGE-AT-0066]